MNNFQNSFSKISSGNQALLALLKRYARFMRLYCEALELKDDAQFVFQSKIGIVIFSRLSKQLNLPEITINNDEIVNELKNEDIASFANFLSSKLQLPSDDALVFRALQEALVSTLTDTVVGVQSVISQKDKEYLLKIIDAIKTQPAP